MTRSPSPSRVRSSHLQWLQGRISERDASVIRATQKCRVLSGQQVQRLHFAGLAPVSAERTRRRVLSRLVSWRVLATLERRIGGVRAGSDGLLFTLDTAGARLLRQW